MPLAQYSLTIGLCKFLSPGEVVNLEPERFTQLHSFLQIKNCFGTGFRHMHVHRPMIIAVESEPETVLLEDARHVGKVKSTLSGGKYFLVSKFLFLLATRTRHIGSQPPLLPRTNRESPEPQVALRQSPGLSTLGQSGRRSRPDLSCLSSALI